MDSLTIAIIGLIIMIVLLLLGMNIGLCFMMVGIVGFAMVTSVPATIGMLRQIPVATASAYNLSVIPLFILMGNVAFAAGMSDGLFDAADKWLGKLPGGVGCASIAACAAFGAICGSAPATAATMGAVAIPAMKKYGYSPMLATGIVSVGGTLGIMIPPSTPFIVYAIMAEKSIGRLFAAGILPGLMTAGICILFIVIMVLINPALAPETKREITWKERFKSLKGVVQAFILFFIVLVGMFSGIFTVNESAAIGAVAAFVMMALSRRLTFKSFIQVTKTSLVSTAMVYIILIGANVFSRFLAISRLPMNIAGFISGLDISRYWVIFIIVLIYAVMGCFIDALPMITLTVPIFLPIITDTLGFDPIWFGVLIILVMQLGFITPPVGMCAYVISGVSGDPLITVFRGALLFVPALVIAIVLIVMFPQLSLFLPNLWFG